MNTLIVKRTLTIFFTGLILFSCQKEKGRKNGTECNLSMANIAGAYKLTKLTYKANASTPETDFLVFMDDCEKDDLITLRAEGKYTYDDEGTVCSPDQSSTGDWRLVNNRIISDGMVSGTVSKFDCQALVLHVNGIYEEGDKLEFTMVRQ